MIYNAFKDLMKMQTILDAPGGIVQVIPSGNFKASYTLIFGAMIFMTIAAFVFAAGGILLTVRFIMLIVFMIFSPLMFLGWIFPKFQNYSSDWWKKFLGYAFFAPAYTFLIFFLYKFFAGMV